MDGSHDMGWGWGGNSGGNSGGQARSPVSGAEPSRDGQRRQAGYRPTAGVLQAGG